MTCPKCQTPVKAGAMFCSLCGASTREPNAPAPSQRGGTVVLGENAPRGEQQQYAAPTPPPQPPFAAQGPARRQGPARSRLQEQLYTILGFVFLALVLAFGASKLWDYLENLKRTRTETKTVIKEIPGKDVVVNGGVRVIGETPEQKQQRELERLKNEQELKDAQARAAQAERDRVEAAQRDQAIQEKLKEIAQDNEKLRQQKEAADLAAQQQAAEAARQQEAQARLEQQNREQQEAANDAQRRLAEANQRARALQVEKDAAAQRTVPVYKGPKFGQLVWKGVVRKGEEVQIDDNVSSAPGGQVISGRLPGVQVQVDVPPDLKGKIQIVGTPNALNDYKKVSFRVVRGDGPITVTLNWNTP